MLDPPGVRQPGRAQVIQGNFHGRRPSFVGPAVAQRQAAPHVAGALRHAVPQGQPVAQPRIIGHALEVPAVVDLAARGRGQALPPLIQRKMEAVFGASFADVRVHVGPQAASIGAVAFTQGSDIFFAPGQYDPHGAHGQRLLGHELAHVVQQRTGRVRNPFGAGVALVQDPGLEAEAERLGNRMAMTPRTTSPVQMKRAPARPSSRHHVLQAKRGYPGGPVLQLCKLCADPTCVDGSKCGLDHNLGGLFADASAAQAGPHRETKQHSQQGVAESEHMVPKAALAASGVAFSYNDEPTLSIPYAVHRGGVSGAGGGVSSTGSSSTASGWSARLATDIASGDWASAIRKTAIDEINAAWSQKALTESFVSGVLQVVAQHHELGRITVAEMGDIKTAVLNHYLNLTGRR